ncbi:hypothetical protein BGW38_010744 [Lunasporangiospora selenospora]|uniref:Elongator complex protein 5 n=1 Tax=Lunasporangiospora selenospora TaxID=979761 RepID=A0A9P6KFI8_9FUNG|nr:hypothetical protein BGW38_010744 [Lunasporangiospora selenospora]
MAPILEKILTRKELSPFILVKDSLEQSGQVLALELLKNTPAEIVAVNCYSNPLGWTPEFESTADALVPSSSLGAATGTNVNTNGITTVSMNLRSIRKAKTSRIIAIHHEDVPDADSFAPDASKPFASNSLAHIATTLIALKNSEALRQDQEDLKRGTVMNKEFCYLSIHGNAWDSAVCEVEHKRKSGKVARETNAYHIGSPTGDLLVVNVWDVVGEMPDIEKLDMEENQTSDPAANLSFNLNLTEEQRRAKNETVLPYLKTQESTGAIYYEPDAGDDFDDDDPDDDLTI